VENIRKKGTALRKKPSLLLIANKEPRSHLTDRRN
jgi:hypothetical protein